MNTFGSHAKEKSTPVEIARVTTMILLGFQTQKGGANSRSVHILLCEVGRNQESENRKQRIPNYHFLDCVRVRAK